MGWDDSIFPTSMKEGVVSGLIGGIDRVGGVSDQPREEVRLVKSSISEVRLAMGKTRRIEQGERKQEIL
jgi:hypothetical protein